MKQRKNYLLGLGLVLSGIFLFPFSKKYTTQNVESGYLVDKKLKSFFNKMIYIEKDTIIMGRMSAFDTRMTPADSTLFSAGIPKRAVVESFYISATEVTNKEWRAFYQDKVKEFGKLAAKRKFYPDTTLWVTEYPYSYNKPMADHYFSNPKFNDYPVVGVTWEQANAYCTWKSQKLKILLQRKGVESAVQFRLPSEAEWEAAAVTDEDATIKSPSKIAYPWPGQYGIWKVNKLTNIGQIHDINNVLLKDYADDGSLYTSKVASYPPNQRGIYNLAGNISEWTSDQGYTASQRMVNKKFKTLTTLSEIKKEIDYLKNEFDEDEFLKKVYLDKLLHDQKILQYSDTKICKGGSWANGLIYTQIGSRQGIRKNKASTKIGFRLAMSDVSPEIKKYFPRKTWKP